jgi:hypothetical protein
MKWSEHIANICKKANNTLSFLKRNLNISNSNLKEKAYQSLVRPTLEYACTTWDPYQQNNKHHIELVVNTSRSFLYSRLITGFVTRLTRRVPLVEQELLTLPEHLSSHLTWLLSFSGANTSPTSARKQTTP